MKKKLIPEFFSKKKREKQQQKTASYAPTIFMGNTCNFSHHKQRRIYQFIVT
jgi:hypothetical protein